MSAKEFILNYTKLNEMSDYKSQIYKDALWINYNEPGLILTDKIKLKCKIIHKIYWIITNNYCDYSETYKIYIYKVFLLVFWAINESSNSFCSILYNRIKLIFDIDDKTEKEWILNDDCFYWRIFINKLFEFSEIINNKKVLNASFLHKIKIREINNELLEIVMHPDNLKWMIDCEFTENKW